ncbi:hypothetical protein [Paraburkholderia mimosarum]|uniref:hypothetical protein n=1 Tax=Paraburkholderia mimosarum TaxID=312026 RepID=UPI000484324E|nr:hypothetical protein [Paraburkholderia mimosarum]
MATLARRIFKVLLFASLFVVSMRFVHTYPLPMTTDQQQRLLELSSRFGVSDSETFYLAVVAVINLLLAALEYLLMMKLWGICRARHRSTHEAGSD